jgi:hypothetical protein
MIDALVALGASALLGLATGLVFRWWAIAVVAPLVALGSAIALAAHGIGFLEGVLVTFACLFVNQLGYFVGVSLESRAGTAKFLVDNGFDDEPSDIREHDVTGEQEEERREHPSRSPPPET